MNKMTLDPLRVRDLMNVLGSVVDEFRLKIYRDGWKVKAVDAANVATISIDMRSSEEFMKYEYGLTDEPLMVGVDVQKVKDFLVGASSGEDIMVGQELTDPVNFSFMPALDKQKNVKKNSYYLDIEQGIYSRSMLLYPENEIRKEPKIPDHLGLDCKLLLNSIELRRMINKASKVSDYIRFNVHHGENVVFTASTVDENDLPWTASPRVYEWGSLSSRTETSSMFSLDYLHDIVKFIPDEKTWLHLGNDKPCRLLFHIGTVGEVEYCQAPRIASE